MELLAELGVEARDLGDVAGLEPRWQAAPPGMRLPNVVPVLDHLRRLRGAVHAALVAHGPPLLVVGGDALVHLAALAGMRDALGEDPGVVWLAPEPPLGTPQRTRGGHIAGMALALALGRGAPPLLEAVDAPLVAPAQLRVVGARPGAAGLEELAAAGVQLAAGAADVGVPEGPLCIAVEGPALRALGVDAARQALLACAVREPVALVGVSDLDPSLGGAVQVAALAAAALR